MNDTICAVSTGVSPGGIGIIRLSGNEAVKIAASVFAGADLNCVDSHTIHFGHIQNGDETIDEVLVSVMRAPKTYTREDVVEINCHGGIIVLKRVMSLLIEKGARPAEPGEFTKRAFLNGRIDLTEAEAVMDIISSGSKYALSGAMQQLSGALSSRIKEIRDKLIYEIAFIESALDDPEHYSLDDYPSKLDGVVNDCINNINRLIESADSGSLIKNGINTVILGKPNAGKSSLLNLLSGTERAIVTDIPGTTRDTLSEQINLNGILLNVTDTAGIRETDDTVEKIGVKRSLEKSEAADLIILVCDSSLPLDENDRMIFEKLSEREKDPEATKQVKIVLLNKSDLSSVTTSEEILKYIDAPVIETSLIDNGSESAGSTEVKGINELENKIVELFFNGKINVNEEVYVANERHKYLLSEAKRSLLLVKKSIEDNMPEDFYSVDLTDAYASLGLIIGEEIRDDVADEIFSKFCMGK